MACAKPILTALLALCLALLPKAQSQTLTAGDLEVHVIYKGSGTVDATHKVYIMLWNSDDFVKNPGTGGPPLAVMSLSTRSGVVTFRNIGKSPVYLSMAYSAKGQWNGDSQPPSGTSLSVYGTQPGTPDPIELTGGKITKISAELDDSYQMP